MDMVSVIIPARNAAKYLEAAIQSVQSQRWSGGLEIIVVDDGSEDETAALAERLGAVVMRQAQMGAAAARNTGLRQAGGYLILFLDADDVLTEDALEPLYAPLAADPSVEAVFSKAVDFISPELTPEQQSLLMPRLVAYDGMLTGCALLRRGTLERVGFFDESLITGETVDWLLRLRDMQVKSISLETVTLRRRLHLTNTGRIHKEREKSDYMAILRKRMQKK